MKCLLDVCCFKTKVLRLRSIMIPPPASLLSLARAYVFNPVKDRVMTKASLLQVLKVTGKWSVT